MNIIDLQSFNFILADDYAGDSGFTHLFGYPPRDEVPPMRAYLRSLGALIASQV